MPAPQVARVNRKTLVISKAFGIEKRNSANPADRQRWDATDILFISAFGESDDREIAFAHFQETNFRRI